MKKHRRKIWRPISPIVGHASPGNSGSLRCSGLLSIISIGDDEVSTGGRAHAGQVGTQVLHSEPLIAGWQFPLSLRGGGATGV